MQQSSQSGALDIIELNDTLFTPDLEEDPRETLTHVPRVAPYNNRNMLTSLQSIPHVKKISVSKRESVSEVIKSPDSKGVQDTPNLPKIGFSQQ